MREILTKVMVVLFLFKEKILIGVMLVLFLFSLMYVSHSCSKSIEERGLKDILTEVWEGKND